MPKKVRKMPQKPRLEQPKKVAAYARVSTGKDAMLHSLSSQVSYYSSLIQNHAGWLYAGVYSDEALTGTKDSRSGFQNLLADCRAGKVNLILTKSISRFARNTVTLLETVRELKALEVDVFFEEQNIYTMSSEGELMLTILASYAQEESLSASENQKWRVRKGFENGELLNWRFLFGYSISKDGIEIDTATAPVVREIFARVIDGETFGAISKNLNSRGVPGALGGKWCAQRIRETVGNEKYTGNAMLQKHYRNNHLEKKKCRNGEVPQYYVEGSHEAIIVPEEFETVQEEMARRKEMGRAYSDKAFHSKIICGDCGGFYGRKVWHSTDEYKSVIFQCNQKFKNTDKCETPNFTEDEIKRRFLTAYNELMGSRDTVIADCELIRKTLCDTTEIDAEMKREHDEMVIVSELMQAHIKKNASVAQSQEAYAREAERIEKRYNAALEHYNALEAEKEKRNRKSKELKAFIAILQQQPLMVTEWNERLWITLLETATVQRDGRIVFRFKSGRKIVR